MSLVPDSKQLIAATWGLVVGAITIFLYLRCTHNPTTTQSPTTTKTNQGKVLICSFNTLTLNTSYYWHVLTTHSPYLFNYSLLFIAIFFIINFFIINFFIVIFFIDLYRHLLYRHYWILIKSTRPSLDLRSPTVSYGLLRQLCLPMAKASYPEMDFTK